MTLSKFRVYRIANGVEFQYNVDTISEAKALIKQLIAKDLEDDNIDFNSFGLLELDGAYIPSDIEDENVIAECYSEYYDEEGRDICEIIDAEADAYNVDEDEMEGIEIPDSLLSNTKKFAAVIIPARDFTKYIDIENNSVDFDYEDIKYYPSLCKYLREHHPAYLKALKLGSIDILQVAY